MKNIYLNHGGLENLFIPNSKNEKYVKSNPSNEKTFFSISHEDRTRKHISDPLKGSAAKRINMFLRWMVRSNKKKLILSCEINKTSQLSCPLDIHTGKVARKLRILKRNQNDFKATMELDSYLKKSILMILLNMTLLYSD